MGLINRCRVCGRNFPPHGLQDAVHVTVRDPEYGVDAEVALCEKCTRKLIAWLSGAKEGLEEDNGQQKTERAPDSEP